MTRLLAALGVLTFVAACGADGMPTRPEAPEQKKEAAAEIAPET